MTDQLFIPFDLVHVACSQEVACSPLWAHELGDVSLFLLNTQERTPNFSSSAFSSQLLHFHCSLPFFFASKTLENPIHSSSSSSCVTSQNRKERDGYREFSNGADKGLSSSFQKRSRQDRFCPQRLFSRRWLCPHRHRKSSFLFISSFWYVPFLFNSRVCQTFVQDSILRVPNSLNQVIMRVEDQSGQKLYIIEQNVCMMLLQSQHKASSFHRFLILLSCVDADCWTISCFC